MKLFKIAPILSLMLAAGFVLAACAPATAVPTEPPAVEPTQPPPAEAPTEAATEAPAAPEMPEVVVDGPELVMYVNAGVKAIFDDVIAPVISEEYGVTLLVEEKVGAEQIAALIAQKANPEVSLTCGLANDNVPVALENELLAPLDYSRLPNAEGLYDIATAEPYGEFGVAWNGAVPWIQYYLPVFEENGWAPPTSYEDFADPKFKGHVALSSANVGAAHAFLQFYSEAAGAPRGDVTPGIEFAKSLVAAGQVHSFPTRSSEFNDLMATGEVWIGNTFGGGTTALIVAGGPVAASIPEEGTTIFTEGCHVVAGASNLDVAHEVINIVLSAEFQQAFIEYRPVIMFRPVTVPDMFVGVIPSTEEEIAKITPLDVALWAENRPIWADLWFREVEAGG
jgi:putative spermidine/putrescine transport system substrate-binding protein